MKRKKVLANVYVTNKIIITADIFPTVKIGFDKALVTLVHRKDTNEATVAHLKLKIKK